MSRTILPEQVFVNPAMVIGLMEKLGLAWNVVRISPERQAQRIAAGQRADIAA